jgi:hypothetical protein
MRDLINLFVFGLFAFCTLVIAASAYAAPGNYGQ